MRENKVHDLICCQINAVMKSSRERSISRCTMRPLWKIGKADNKEMIIILMYSEQRRDYYEYQDAES